MSIYDEKLVRKIWYKYREEKWKLNLKVREKTHEQERLTPNDDILFNMSSINKYSSDVWAYKQNSTFDLSSSSSSSSSFEPVEGSYFYGLPLTSPSIEFKQFEEDLMYSGQTFVNCAAPSADKSANLRMRKA